MSHHREVVVKHLPMCDICREKIAYVDGKTTDGPWAYMCTECHPKHGVGLGLGKGQQLILDEKK